MRLYLIVPLLLLATTCAAQQVFEGTITYVLKERGETQATLTVYFSRQAIRATFADEKGMDKEQLLYIADSNMIAQMNMVEKTYRAKYFTPPPSSDGRPLIINGHSTKAVTAQGGRDGGGFPEGAMFYVADDLFYPVPPHMTHADELIMINNDHIVLGFIMSNNMPAAITTFDSAFNDPEFRGVIAQAVKIEAVKPDAALFTLPADYTRLPSYDERAAPDGDNMYDSTAPMLDTSAAYYDDEPVVVDTVVSAPPRVTKPAKVPANKQAPAKKRKTPEARKPD